MSVDDGFSKKPKDTDFHQQTLRSWNPLILMNTVLPLFAGLGTVFTVIGICLLLLSRSVNEFRLDYTDCIQKDTFNGSSSLCSSVITMNGSGPFPTCTCVIPFLINTSFEGQVYLYYMIQNLYQNHRRYAKSMDHYQLLGKPVRRVTSNCDPYGSVTNGSVTEIYAPCGIIANSLFNDSFQLDFRRNGSVYSVPMSSKGIAWKVDKDILYGRPQNWDNTLKPVNWPQSAWERNNGSYSEDEELLVWMRTAPFSNFKKLHRIVQHTEDPFKTGLPIGQYELSIRYAYPVSMFRGRKWIVLSTTNGLGGKNNNLGIMYMVVGALHLCITIVFAVGLCLKKNSRQGYDMPPTSSALFQTYL